MKYHIEYEGKRVASFEFKGHRDQVFDYWTDRFLYAADLLKKTEG